jgi:type I restriction enzyme S subunit
MAGRYRVYPEYRDSGIQWLGKVPLHWLTAQFKWQIDRNDGGVWGGEPGGEDDTIVLRSTEQTVDGFWKIEDPAPRQLSASEIRSAILVEGDLLVTKSSGSSNHIGKTTLVDKEISALNCCYSNFMQRIRTKISFLPKFAWYIMNNNLARLQFDLLSNSTTGLANLNATLLGQISIPVPSFEEQGYIVDFLDHETTKINALINKQQQLIALLKEKRQAVISHAVTKGLNPDAPMKDSGVEWLGEVPEHWEVVALKHLVWPPITDGPHVSPTKLDDGVPFVSAEAVSQGFIDFTKIWGYVSPEDHEQFSTRYKSARGDILMVKLGATTGTVAIVETDVEFSIWVPLAAIRPTNKIESRFLLHVLRSDSLKRAYELNWTYGTQQTLGLRTISNLRIPLPPSAERQEIVQHIDAILPSFELLTAEAQRAIDLLQERRTALISAAVTGKIDVRNWQPPTETPIS